MFAWPPTAQRSHRATQNLELPHIVRHLKLSLARGPHEIGPCCYWALLEAAQLPIPLACSIGQPIYLPNICLNLPLASIGVTPCHASVPSLPCVLTDIPSGRLEVFFCLPRPACLREWSPW